MNVHMLSSPRQWETMVFFAKDKVVVAMRSAEAHSCHGNVLSYGSNHALVTSHTIYALYGWK